MINGKWWPVCAAVLRGAMRALDEASDEPPSREALEITQFVLRELAPLRGLSARAWAPPTPEGGPVCTAEDCGGPWARTCAPDKSCCSLRGAGGSESRGRGSGGRRSGCRGERRVGLAARCAVAALLAFLAAFAATLGRGGRGPQPVLLAGVGRPAAALGRDRAGSANPADHAQMNRNEMGIVAAVREEQLRVRITIPGLLLPAPHRDRPSAAEFGEATIGSGSCAGSG